MALSEIGLDPDRPDKYADHNRINDILYRLVSVQQDLLSQRYAPGLSRIGDQLGELDDSIVGLNLQTAREMAWQVAVLRSDVRWMLVEKYTRWILSRTATGGAYLLLRPKASPETMAVLRDIETNEFDLSSFAETFHNYTERPP